MTSEVACVRACVRACMCTRAWVHDFDLRPDDLGLVPWYGKDVN